MLRTLRFSSYGETAVDADIGMLSFVTQRSSVGRVDGLDFFRPVALPGTGAQLTGHIT